MLPVVTAPADVLSTPCVDVDPRDPAVVQLAADLLATQRVSPGCVGLAANQVGVGWRVFSPRRLRRTPRRAPTTASTCW